jgi:PTH1 family peptidyl-tRNA hydrolase
VTQPLPGATGTSSGTTSPGTWLVVGLGNPGPEYAGNRHNVGAMVLGVLAGRVGGALRKHKARLGVLPGGAPGPRVVLAQPSTYMNESGGPVAALSQFYKTDLAHLVVVHDELDISYGDVRLKLGGGEGGHNGLRSVSRSCGGRDYLRVRVGIGRPPGRQDPADYVLKDFSSVERRDLGVLLEEAADAVEDLVTQGLLVTQQRFHAP